ncbi:MAG: hypothetical protein GC136_05390 [Alphaproteobacteria bacterium]|nr:hypothetical protein [Alphaproteobacteria bacterium]
MEKLDEETVLILEAMINNQAPRAFYSLKARETKRAVRDAAKLLRQDGRMQAAITKRDEELIARFNMVAKDDFGVPIEQYGISEYFPHAYQRYCLEPLAEIQKEAAKDALAKATDAIINPVPVYK